MSLLIVALVLFVASNAQTCPNQGRVCDRENECCSKWGWCGTGDAWCDNTYDFGDCPDGVCEGEETPAPVSAGPFNRHCNCICYGDPHCKMWNCAVNNWQGPHVLDAMNVYYMTRCNGYTLDDMPFDVIGVNQRYDNYFTSLDYTILKLYDNDEAICIKNKGINGVSYNNDCNGNTYDSTPNQNEVVSVGSNSKFEITWESQWGYSKLYLKVKNNGCEDYDLTIITMTATDKEEAVEIKVSECYKKYTCGMCGDFYNTGLNFQILNGDTIKLDPGCWGGTANDETGLTYMVDIGTTTTPEPQRRRLQDVGVPCFGLKQEIETACNAQLKQYAACCWDRREFCEELIDSCGWDSCSCIMGKAVTLAEAQSENVVDLCIASVLNASMSFTCGLPSENFIVPDMTIYESQDATSEKCENSSGAGFLFVGIAIGCFICGIVGVLIYVCVIKPKLEGAEFVKTANTMNEVEDETNTANGI